MLREHAHIKTIGYVLRHQEATENSSLHQLCHTLIKPINSGNAKPVGPFFFAISFITSRVRGPIGALATDQAACIRYTFVIFINCCHRNEQNYSHGPQVDFNMVRFIYFSFGRSFDFPGLMRGLLQK